MFFRSKKKKEEIDLWFLEKNINIFFRKQNYILENVQKPNPHYLQLIFSKNGQKIVVLGRIDLPAGDMQFVQDALQAKLKFNCTKALVIVNAKFTKEAKKLARAEQVEIWDDKKILKNLLPVNSEATPLHLPGANDLEKALQEMSTSLGINSEKKGK